MFVSTLGKGARARAHLVHRIQYPSFDSGQTIADVSEERSLPSITALHVAIVPCQMSEKSFLLTSAGDSLLPT